MKRKILFLVLCLFLSSFFQRVLPSFASVPIRFECPEEVCLGEPFPVSIWTEKKLERVDLGWLSHSLISSPRKMREGWIYEFILGSDVKRDERGTHLLYVTLRSPEGDIAFSWQIRILGKTYPEERLSVPGEMVTPPETVLGRIARERKAVHEALGTITPDTMWQRPFSVPLSGDITSCYGKNRYYNGRKGSRHGGVDLRAVPGTPVKAVADGMVILTGDHYFAGKSVYVDHGNGLISMYFHLSSICVEKGEKVLSGETVVGLSGSSGRVTGPHLHLGISIDGDMVDPVGLFTLPSEGKGIVDLVL